jgi:hypothetical protein
LLVFVVAPVAALVTVHAFSQTWTNDPADCVPTGPDDMWSGQNCYTNEFPNANCGVSGSMLRCTPLTNIANAPAITPTSTTQYSGSYGGGFLVNCLATSDAAEPFCDNNGGYWCNSSTTCSGSGRNRVTRCVSGVWAGNVENTNFTCPACMTNYYDCNPVTDACEIHRGDSCGLPGSNAVYGVGCNGTSGNCICSAGSYDCNSGSNPFDYFC